MNEDELKEIIEVCKKANDWDLSFKAAIRLYTYADTLMQISQKQRIMQEKNNPK